MDITFPRKIKTKFVTNDKGRKVAVVIPIKEYEDLTEDMIDLAACIERRNDESLPWEQVKKELIADGTLQP
jgi:hypothetical protein